MEDQEIVQTAQREMKRNYLTEEIINEGYDAEQFVLWAGKGQDVDIDQWTFEELQDVVTEFKQNAGELRQEDKPPTVDRDLLPSAQEKEVQEDIAVVEEEEDEEDSPSSLESSYDSQKEEEKTIEAETPEPPIANEAPPEQKDVEDESETYTFPPAQEPAPPQAIAEEEQPDPGAANETEVSDFVPSTPPPVYQEELKETEESRETYIPVNNTVVSSLHDIEAKYYIPGPSQVISELFEISEVTLSDPELVQKGMFKSDFAVYNVMTEPNGWAVKRRFTDFVWLRNTLVVMYGGHAVPSLPKEVNSGTADAVFPKRKFYLQRFINNVVSIPVFRMCPFLLSFLKETDTKEFEKEKKQTKTLKKPDSMDLIYTAKGCIPVNPDTPCSQFNSKVQEYLKQYEMVQKKMKRLSASIMGTFKQLSSDLMQLLSLVNSAHAINGLLPD